MFSIKRIELVIEAVEKSNVISTLKKINITSYTIYKHVGGSGERGARDELAFGEKFENVTFVIACPENRLSNVIESLRPILKSYGGMCLVSDAQWVIH
ncbi:MAG: transcriptional regulator [Methylophilus sp.]|nr:transcriptional regulator [Methylophilus sp.]